MIRREFRLAEGDAFNRLLVEAARKRLRALGFFKTVDIDTEPGSAPDRVVIVVKVEEQPTGELSFGAGYSTSEGVIGDISLTERNLMGKGQYVRLGFSGSFERAQVDFSFTEPHFLDRNLAAGFDLFHKEVDLHQRGLLQAARRRRQYPVRIPHRRRYPAWSALQVRARGNLRRDGRCLACRAAIAEGTANVSSIGYTVAYDTRNIPNSPTSGAFVSLSQDLAGVGGDVRYIRSVADARGYYPVTNKITLVGRAQGGAIEGWGGDDVRMTDLFFKGGETVRGFERAGFGPATLAKIPSPAAVGHCTRDALGGQLFWATTAELRFPFPFIPDSLGMQGAFFVDAGSLLDPSAACRCGKTQPRRPASSTTARPRACRPVSASFGNRPWPVRADIAEALLKAEFDRTELFRFGASTNF